MDPRKVWLCTKCGSRLTDEQRVREGCQVCLEREWIKEQEKRIEEEIKRTLYSGEDFKQTTFPFKPSVTSVIRWDAMV